MSTLVLTPDRVPDLGAQRRPAAADPSPPLRTGHTGKLLTRIVVAVAVLVIAGTVLVTTTSATWSRALGLSMVFPGGGFLYEALPLAFLLTLVPWSSPTVLWWGISAHFAIPLVWAVVGRRRRAARRCAPAVRRRGTTWPWAIPVVYVFAAVAVVHDGRPASSGPTAASWPRCRS